MARSPGSRLVTCAIRHAMSAAATGHHRRMDVTVVVIFGLVYLGMVLGEIPGLALDRTGIALLGAIALVVSDKLTLAEAWGAVDVPTICLLFGLMVVSAQFRLGGFYSAVTRTLAGRPMGPAALLAWLVAMSGALSAVLANDIVCLAMAPVLAEGCARRGLNPVPFLLGLACAANVGSAATLIGNPQNMLIGQALGLSFVGYLGQALVPSVLGLGIVWGVLVWLYRHDWLRQSRMVTAQAPPFDAWQTGKGAVVTVLVVAAFVATDWPRELVALGAAGVILLSRRTASRDFLGLVDWELLVLFVGLFVVNAALADSGTLAAVLDRVRAAGLAVEEPASLFGLTVVLSNLVSNVPAVMLLLPVATHPLAGATLALASTLAGNLLIVGSIANVIVVDAARRLGVEIDWRTHARAGVPITAATLALAALWLWGQVS
jgi:Na+/H+ antiporter NhaD/arsenite permease-like protein